MDVECLDPFVTAKHAPNAPAVDGIAREAMVLARSLFLLLDSVKLERVRSHEFAHLEGTDGLLQAISYGFGQTIVVLLAIVHLPAFSRSPNSLTGPTYVPVEWPRSGRPNASLRSVQTREAATGG